MASTAAVSNHLATHRDAISHRFLTLELARGIAASMVALSHAVGLCAEARWYGVIPFDNLLVNMDVGVDFFFVLSGFIVTFVHWNDFGRPERLSHYASRRFSRVYPPYWIILSAIVPVYLLVPTLGKESQHTWLSVLTSYLLVPMPQQPVLGVAWTLTYEMFFYFLVGLAIVLGKRAAPVFFVWLGVILSCQLFGLRDYPFSFVGNTFGTEFLLGIAVAIWLRRGAVRFPGILLAIGLVVFCTGTFLMPGLHAPGYGAWARLLFGPAAAFIIAGCVELERSKRLFVPVWLLPLGAASFAIYLTHVVTESALIRAGMRLGFGTIGPEAMALTLAFAGMSVGFIYHYWVEKPLTIALRRWLP